MAKYANWMDYLNKVVCLNTEYSAMINTFNKVEDFFPDQPYMISIRAQNHAWYRMKIELLASVL